MPKVSYRCQRRGNYASAPATLTGFVNAPRKVSFEDGHHESDSDSSSRSLAALTEAPAPLSRKSTLVRPKSSMSLVDLVKSAEDSKVSSMRERCVSAPVSPVLSPLMIAEPSSAPTVPSSPWGQFVDMVVAEDRDEARGAAHLYHEPTCSCCTFCRRRRASPYGDFKKSRGSPFFLPGSNPSASWSKPSGFRLSPRKEPADQLIGALHKLQVLD